MTTQRFSILLILLMVITQVASAFDHCMNEFVPHNLSGHQSGLDAGLAGQSKHQAQKQVGDSHSTHAYCTFHVCGDCGLTMSVFIPEARVSHYFPSFQAFTPTGIVASPDIRPPITLLRLEDSCVAFTSNPVGTASY